MSFLDEIVASTRARIEETKEKVTQEALEQRLAGVERARSFGAAVSKDDISLIAEIKRATPSRGALALDVSAAERARAYAEGGAAAVSVLTEPEFFQGSLEDMQAASGAGLPVLRKDFVLDEFQVLEARAWGADAVLLIVRILDDALGRLLSATRALGMDALVEVHDSEEVERAVDAGATLIGVNHRDLGTFEVDPERTAKLAPRLPKECTLVALSGVSERREVEDLRAAGARAVLVGEALVTAPDPAAKIRELLGR